MHFVVHLRLVPAYRIAKKTLKCSLAYRCARFLPPELLPSSSCITADPCSLFLRRESFSEEFSSNSNMAGLA